jgi:hypothetical protein
VTGPYAELEPAQADRSAEAALTDAGLALRDARRIAGRIAADEAAADAARARYLADGLPHIDHAFPADEAILNGERLHAIHRHAVLERTSGRAVDPLPSGGTLYLTSVRLLHLATDRTEIALGSIDEIGLALERLVLIRLSDGSDLALEVDQPRLLRVQMAAAIATLRGAAPID